MWDYNGDYTLFRWIESVYEFAVDMSRNTRCPPCTNAYMLEKRRQRAINNTRFVLVVALLALLWCYFPQLESLVNHIHF